MSDRQGRCFELAFSAMLEPENAGAVLMHGTVIGRGGSRIDHAWLIIEDGAAIYDPVFDRLILPTSYNARFAPEEERRYSAKEAAEEALNQGHSGPWHK